MDCVIVGQGLVSPVALGVMEHAFFIRASVEAPPPPAFATADGKRVRAKHCGFLGASLDMAERLSRMAEIAAHQALASWEASVQTSSLALAFIAPHRRGIEPHDIAEVRTRIAKRCRAAVVQTWYDAAGVFDALNQAHTWMSKGDVSGVLILGVDSFVHVDALQEDILSAESPFLPNVPPASEAAAAILVTREELCRMYALTGARVHACATAMGRGTDDDDAIVDGLAMTSLLHGLPDRRIDLVVGQEKVNDLRAGDWALATARLAHRLSPQLEVMSPENDIGRIGAAAGIANLAFGTGILRHKVYRDLPPNAHFAAWAISRNGTRGVALVQGSAERYAARIFAAAHDGPTLRDVERTEVTISEPISESDDDVGGSSPDIDATPLVPSLEVMGASNDNDCTPNGVESKVEASVRIAKDHNAPVPLLTGYAEIAASCLDGLAMSARHRALLPWEGRRREEERILAFLDALVVTPRFPALLGAWWEDAVDLPDPWKVWAPSFVLSCLDGRDVPEALAGIWRRIPEGEIEPCVCAGEALALGANLDRRLWLRRLVIDSHPAVRASSVHALSLLEALEPDEIAGLLDSDTDRVVRWVALRAAANFPDDRKLTSILVAELRTSADRELVWQCARALLLRGISTVYDDLRRDPQFLRRLGPYALDILAWCGNAMDASLARQIVAHSGLTSNVIRGLARYGHAGAAPLLVRALGDEDAAEEAAAALVWIFGMPFEESKTGLSEAWRAWFKTAPLDEDIRYRFGKAYRPGRIAEAAANELRSQAELAWLVDEANVRTGLRERIAPFRWTPEVDAALAKSTATFQRHDEHFDMNSWHSAARFDRRRA